MSRRITLAILVATGLLASASHASNVPKHPTSQASPYALRQFALTALQRLKGPAQRPFVDLLNKLPPVQQVGVTISARATKNMQCSGGVCTPTAAKATLNVSDLTRLLGDGSLTIGTSAQAPDVFVNAPFSWTSANGLTLQAIGNIVVNKAFSDSGPAPLSLTYNANGAGGTLSFGTKGHISFASPGNALTINGQGYILASNIQTLAQLIARNPSGRFALSASYNARQDGKYTQSPIQTVFQGNFEGLGNSITGFRMNSDNSDQPNGFFAQTSATAFIDNFNLAGQIEVPLTDSYSYVGGVVGDNQGTLFQASFDGTIGFIDVGCQVLYVGGLVGTNEGTISFSHATGTINGPSLSNCLSIFGGGLIGVDASAADYSWAGVSVLLGTYPDASNLSLGGLIGWMHNDSADQVFAVGPVTGSGQNDYSPIGGLVGEMDGLLSHSSASGAVSAGDDNFIALVGGLVGQVGGTVVDGVATGSVTGTKCRCGGAVGEGSQISDTTSFGSVSGTTVGGFIGYDDQEGDLSNNGWCTTSSGITDPSQGAGNIPNDSGITAFSC